MELLKLKKGRKKMAEKKLYSLGELATLTASQLMGDPQYLIHGVEDLEQAGPEEIAFLDNPRYEKQLFSSKAGAVIVPSNQTPLPTGRFLLLNKFPSFAFQQILSLFITAPPSGFLGIHPTAIIHPEAVLDQNVEVGPYSVIDRGAKIREGTRIGASVFIGAEALLGKGCVIHAHVTIREGCELGNRVIIQPGAVIGSCGFGYFTDDKGIHHPLKQLGKVVLEDDVEIGANTTIDRARFKTTYIGAGTKIDNLVQIAHQVSLGEHNLIVSQVGIAGSTKTGHHVIMGGQVGVVGHLHITDQVMLAARSAVSKSIEKSGIYSGAPAIPIKEFNEQFVKLKNISKWMDRLKALEERLSSLEKTALKDQKSAPSEKEAF